MGLKRILLGTTLALMVGAGGARAENLALIIGNTTYNSFPSVQYSAIVEGAVGAFQAADYEVISLENGTEAQTKNALDRFERSFENAEKVVVVLSGQFLHAGTSSWFAPVDLQSPSLASAGFDALPLAAILAFLAEKPGDSALFLGKTDQGARVGATIEKGIGPLHIPQGVTVVQGPPKIIVEALEKQFLQEDVSVAQAAADTPLVVVEGFVSDEVSFNGTPEPSEVGSVPDVSEVQVEDAYWRVSEDIGSKASYKAYLRRYPNGEYVGQAEQRLQIIEDAAPKYSPQEQAELNLNLTRNDRRRIQEQLSLIGYDPRGIDGVFGPGSRGAITRWQAQNGIDASGFMDSPSLLTLRAQAESRAAELAQEARRKKEEQDQADAKLWAQTGARGSEADLTAYLTKYPDGLYADAARQGLERIEAQNRASAKAEERLAWDQARKVDTVKAYRGFLRSYPEGTFAKTAEARINARQLSDEQRVLNAAAKQEEAALQMSTSMRVLIERKLQALGQKPGKADGTFNKQTRKAIRSYQKTRGLQPTGFVSRNTIIRLMSE